MLNKNVTAYKQARLGNHGQIHILITGFNSSHTFLAARKKNKLKKPSTY